MKRFVGLKQIYMILEYDADINVIVKNEEHFNYWLGALPFYDNVQREGIVLNG